MARVKLRIELDGGGVLTFVEVSNIPITGGAQAALLTQEAFAKALGALGLGVPQPPQTEPPNGGGEPLRVVDNDKPDRPQDQEVPRRGARTEPKG